MLTRPAVGSSRPTRGISARLASLVSLNVLAAVGAVAQPQGPPTSAADTGGARSPVRDPAVAPAAASIRDALLRAGEYVTRYEELFSNLVAEEKYTQEVETPRTSTYYTYVSNPMAAAGASVPVQFTNQSRWQQVTRADLVFVRLAGPLPWASYRDVFEVNGKKVREREQRLLALFSSPSPDVHERAKALLAASAQYNIGRVTRTINLPTLPLLFLIPANQGRFSCELGDGRTISATETVQVRFRELARPTLVSGPNGTDVPTFGSFWINPTRGTVVRSEVHLDFGPDEEALVTTEYASEPRLAMWVPVEMKERYADLPRAKVRVFPDPFTGTARYSRFRRFTVISQEGGPALPR